MPDNVYEQKWSESDRQPDPVNNFSELTSPDNPWLQKTDWCCDRIIANDD